MLDWLTGKRFAKLQVNSFSRLGAAASQVLLLDASPSGESSIVIGHLIILLLLLHIRIVLGITSTRIYISSSSLQGRCDRHGKFCWHDIFFPSCGALYIGEFRQISIAPMCRSNG